MTFHNTNLLSIFTAIGLWHRIAYAVNSAFYILAQRGPNPGTRAACVPRTVFVQPVNTLCVPDISQNHKYSALAA